jgi:6-phosphogluconolactonase (cycloisomerase 2 family)
MSKRTFRFLVPCVTGLALFSGWMLGEPPLQRGTPPAASGAAAETRKTTQIMRAPARQIRDPYAGFSAVAVDVARNEIILQDENHAQIAVYGRTDNTPPQATLTEPKRVIGGGATKIQHNCGVYVDPASGDIYSINGDITQYLTVWSREQKGNQPAERVLETPHRTYGIAVDEEAKEMYITTQHPAAVLVWPKTAEGKQAPLRILEGDHTQLAEAQGVAVDTKNQLLYVSNKGAWAALNNNIAWGRLYNPDGTTWNISQATRILDFVPGTGEYRPPSITVYPLKAKGDTAPLRVIQGSQTRLDWPSQMAVDVERQELYVTGPVSNEILVFRTTDSGNVAPIRVLKGNKTGLSTPNDVFVDTVNDEIVVANFGNHSSTVYPRNASGNTAPIRTIRAAPADAPAPMFGNIGAITYDTKRNQFLTFN